MSSGLVGDTVEKFIGMYRGVVVDNHDPEHKGRIKVMIFPMFNGFVAVDIPWAVAAMPLFSGSGRDPDPNPDNTGWGSFVVPDNGTWVFCFFENGEIHQPVYFAEAPTGIHGLPSARELLHPATQHDYPKVRVWRTEHGIQIKIDDYFTVSPAVDNRHIRIDHPSGTFIVLQSDGTVKVHASKKIDLDADDNIEERTDASMLLDAVSKFVARGASVSNLGDSSDTIVQGSELSIGAPVDTVPPFSTSETRRIWVVISSSPTSVTVEERRLGLSIPPSPAQKVISLAV